MSRKDCGCNNAGYKHWTDRPTFFFMDEAELASMTVEEIEALDTMPSRIDLRNHRQVIPTEAARRVPQEQIDEALEQIRKDLRR